MHEAIITMGKILKSNSLARPFPTQFIYPGLSSKPLYDKANFDFTNLIEQNIQAIKQEYLKGKEIYKINDYEPKIDKLPISGKVQWLSFIKRGAIKKEFKQIFPKTSKLLEGVPSLIKQFPFANTMIYTMLPESSIAKYHGPCNIKLKCVLPIITNEECYMRIAGIPRQLEVGKIIIFDDTYENEEANLDEKQESVNLSFDIWHPELSAEEIHSIENCFKKIEMQIEEKKKAQTSKK